MRQPRDILSSFLDANANDMRAERLGVGSINETWGVTEGGESTPSFVLQQMHSLFAPHIMQDILHVTSHLKEKGLLTQEVVRTQSGDLYVPDETSWWRMLTYVPGNIYQSLPSTQHAHSAGTLVGSFHEALADFTTPLVHTLAGFHDTALVMEKLRRAYDAHKNSPEGKAVSESIETILTQYAEMPDMSALPKRIIHGDLKISNVCFDTDTDEARALIDLDTLMQASIAIELGDALRSWCANGDEDTKHLSFNTECYTAAVSGYISSATFLTEEERKSIPDGIALITLEIAARFLTDALEQSYFRHDASLYPSLYEQNKTRGENQLSLFKDFKTKRHLI
ncbi:MAG TPA: phosphotransferase [Candidatus Paceibacterota bacterium]|nr:phosphotransferase [Candidatus Paceibacterota bacterium]